MSYKLTAQQQQTLINFTVHYLYNIIDEHISGAFLVPDELVDADDWTAINARKLAAIKFIADTLHQD